MSAKTILIVEDDEDLRTGLQEVLEDEGYTTLLAHHGAHALEILRTQPTTLRLILLDWMMAVLDGPGFLLQLQNEPNLLPSNTSIVVMTASPDPQIHSYRSGLKLLKKPVDLEELLSEVAKYFP